MQAPVSSVRPSRIWLTGGTGLVGSAFVRLVRSSPHVEHAVSWERSPRAKSEAGTVESRAIDFEALCASPTLPVAAGESPPQVAVCCLGTTRAKAGSAEAFRRVDLDYVVAFAKAAHSAGASCFLLVTSIGSDPRSRLLYARTKGEAEEAVKELGFESTYLLRPSILDGDREEHRLGERVGLVFGRALGPLLGDARRPIHADVVARAVLACALEQAPGVHVVESDGLWRIARRTG